MPGGRTEKITSKVRVHSLQKVRVILVCGMRAAEGKTGNVHRLGSRDQEAMTLGEAIARLTEEATPPDLLRLKK